MRRLGRLGGADRVGGRQPDLEHAASPWFARDPHRTLHAFDQRLDDRQTDARAFDSLSLDTQAIEGFEQVLALRGRQPAPGVGHPDRLLISDHPGLDRDPPASPVVLDRVGEQIDQHLAQPGAVGQHCPANRARLHGHLHVASLRLQQDQGFVDHPSHIDRLQREPDIAGLQARQIEHIVDQGQQVFARRADMADSALLSLVQGCRLDRQQLREAQHGVQWRAQLMAHPGEKARLGLAFAVGDLAFLARGRGILRVGDVPVDADPADHPALVVGDRCRP